MLWDASQAYANNRYDKGIKSALVAAGGTGFTYPACSAPGYVSGTAYQAGSQVSYGGYIWQAEFFASSTPTNNPSGEWSAISACSQSGTTKTTASGSTGTTVSTDSNSIPTSSSGSPSISSSPSIPSSSTTTVATTCRLSVRSSSPASNSTATSASPAATSSSGSCSGIAAWSTGVVYNAGQQVTYGNHLWTAKYWTVNDTPGGPAGSWADDSPCTTKFKRNGGRLEVMAQAPVPPPQYRTGAGYRTSNLRVFRDILTQGNIWNDLLTTFHHLF